MAEETHTNDEPEKEPDAEPKPEADPAETSASEKKESKEAQKKLTIRMWPKTPVLYPMAFCALLFGILSHVFGSSQATDRYIQYQIHAEAEEVESVTPSEEVPTAQQLKRKRGFDRVLAFIFLIVVAISLFTICVDFEVRWAIIAAALLVIVVLALALMNQFIDKFPNILKALTELTALVSPQFYFAIFLIWAVLMLVSFFVVRFHYVRIESNELVVVGGFLESQKRMSTFRMNYTKEVQDVMEYYLPLVRSGRLVFTFPGEEQAVVIDNVIQIDKVIAELDTISSSLRVEGPMHDHTH